MTIVAERARRAEPHFGVVFAVRPMFDRAHPAVIGEMTRALDTLLREHESEGRAGCVLCLQR
jgi:hypothetical protein